MDIPKGTLDLMILKALSAGTSHGYGLAKWIHSTTDGALEIDDGALYPALHRLESRGWIGAEWGVSDNNRRARYYALRHRDGEDHRGRRPGAGPGAMSLWRGIRRNVPVEAHEEIESHIAMQAA